MSWRPKPGAAVQTLSFESAGARELAGRNLVKERAAGGEIAMTWHAEGWREYLDAKAAAQGADLRIVVHEWATARATTGTGTDAHSLSVPDAVERYLKLRLAENVREGTDTWRHYELHLRKRFASAFRDRQLHEVTSDDIRSWMHGLKDPKTGAPMGNLTKRHHRKDVNTFFRRAVLEEWVRKNPVERVKPPSFDDDEHVTRDSVMAVADLRRLFLANRDQPVIGRMALELWGGMRASSAERAVRENFNFAERGFELPGQKHKSGKRKYRTGHPAALWAWLEHAGERAWTEVTERNYDRLKSEAFIRADVKNPGNGLRHSFVSYHLALFKNPGLTQRLAQHRHFSTTEGYEGFATEADARAWAEILP